MSGPGRYLLRRLGAESQFVIIGEEHGNTGIAEFATAFWRELNDAGYNYAVVEADPWVTKALEDNLKSGGVDKWTRFALAHGGVIAAPFFTWAPEAKWAGDIVARSRAKHAPILWGVDQVFIGSARWLMKEIASTAKTDQSKDSAKKILGLGTDNPNWMSQVPSTELRGLAQTLRDSGDSQLSQLVDAMIQSQRIYRPFTGGGGEAYLANVERENLMRMTFLERYKQAEKAEGAPPRVLMKLGASHAFRGASTLTQIQGFGGFVSEFAAAQGRSALTLLALCGETSEASNITGASTPCLQSQYGQDWTFLKPYIDPAQVTVFDLRVWRLRPKRWAHLPEDVQRAIGSFDVLVVPQASKGSLLLPGMTPPVFPKG